MMLLGVDCLMEHVKRWCVSCGVGRVRRAGKRLQLIVGRARNSRVLLQRVRLSVVSATSGTRTTHEWRGRKQKTQRQIRTIFLRKSRKRRSENSEKPSQNRRKIDEKSPKMCSWAALGAWEHRTDALGRVQESPGTSP